MSYQSSHINEGCTHLSNFLASTSCSTTIMRKIAVPLTVYQGILKFCDAKSARSISIDGAEPLPELRISASWKTLLLSVLPGLGIGVSTDV